MKKTFQSLLLLVVSMSVCLGNPSPEQWGGAMLRKEAGWYASAEARTAADAVLTYQSGYGAWPKNWNLLEPATKETLQALEKSGSTNTTDNGATTLPMRFLARVHEATGEVRYAKAVEKAVEYLLESQYANGGFPQFYPLRGDAYYSQITFNDNAMINVLNLLKEVADGKAPFAFVGEALQLRAGQAVDLGVQCILNTQILQNGKRTAWCAQHDSKTLEPAWARAYEAPSLSGSESVGIVLFLMAIDDPDPEVIAAVQGAVAWFEQVPIHGKRLKHVPLEDGRLERVLTDEPGAPRMWARFYELETNRPIFLDRDSVVRYHYHEVGNERRSGYAYLGYWAEDLLNVHYPQWYEKIRMHGSVRAGIE
jgi:PelA/Pel-15E family pectate lyase